MFYDLNHLFSIEFSIVLKLGNNLISPYENIIIMKKLSINLIGLIALLFTAIPTLAQDDASIPGSSSSSALPQSTFHINALGLIQFGPVFMYEARMGTGKAYFAPYFRYTYAGLLTHLDWDADYVSPLNLGFGVQIKTLSPVGGQNNVLYYGGGIEIDVGSANYDVDTQFETIEKFIGLPIYGTFGYRWRSPSRKIINVGISLGYALTLKDEETFVSDGSLYANYTESSVFAMLEFSFGWEKIK